MHETEIMDQPVYHPAYRLATLYPAPGRLYTIHRVGMRGLAIHQAKIFHRHPPRRGQRSPLALVVGAAFRGNLPITLPQDRIVYPDVDLHLVITGSISAAKIEGVPQDPLRLPW